MSLSKIFVDISDRIDYNSTMVCCVHFLMILEPFPREKTESGLQVT